jgi:hypothetical protein
MSSSLRRTIADAEARRDIAPLRRGALSRSIDCSCGSAHDFRAR